MQFPAKLFLRKENWLHYERFQHKEESVFAGNYSKLMQHPQPLSGSVQLWWWFKAYTSSVTHYSSETMKGLLGSVSK